MQRPPPHLTSAEDVRHLEVGDRTTGDERIYPDDELKALLPSAGAWLYAHKNGSPCA
jgi:uncharacterized cupin superfamily protein